MKKYLLITSLILTYLLYCSNYTAIGVVLDTRLIVVILSICLLVIVVFNTFKSRTLFAYALLLLSFFISGLSLNELYLKYYEEEISFQSEGYDFYGTLYTPRKNSTNCLVVFLHGSGSENRKEYSFHARHLARNGIAGFAYDKRGSGKSGGNTYDVGYDGYAKDAIAAISKLKDQRTFDRVGIFAISEGEWVSLIVDSLEQIDFIVMVSASGTSPFHQTLRELTYRLERKGFSRDEIHQASELYTEILTFDNDSMSRKQIELNISKSIDKNWFQGGEDFDTKLYYYPWWHQVMHFSPTSFLEITKTEILVLIGQENESYPYSETKRNFDRFQKVEVLVFENGDHSLLEWKFGRSIPPPVYVDGYLDAYTNWIIEKCKNL